MDSLGSLTIGRDLQEVGAAADQVRAWLADVLDEDGLAAVELALSEALTNAVRHGIEASSERIGVFVEASADAVALEIADSSPPMPSLVAEAGADKLDFDPDDLQALSEGGRGLSLIVLSMDEVVFRKVGDQVRLRMILFRKRRTG